MADEDAYYNTCLTLTKEVGKVICEAINKPKDITVKTNDCDLVTETDKQVEDILILGLQKAFPSHKVIAEETASQNGTKVILTDDPTWIIDPIDGTLNFVHAFPLVAVSIALYIGKKPVVGIIYNPVLDQMFTARAGKGAFLNGRRINVSGQKEFSKSLICMGVHRDPVNMPFYEKTFWNNLDKIIGRVQGCRVTGSAALSMAFVASGAADAHFERGLQPWDMAAGELLIREAGGVLVNFRGEPFDVMKGQLICAASEELAKTFAETLYYGDVHGRPKENTNAEK